MVRQRSGILGARSSSVSGVGAFAAIGAAALCLAFSSKLNSETLTPKFAILLLFAAVGIVPLFRLALKRSPLRWPAIAAVVFLAVALASALLSRSPHVGFFGLYLWGTGWLFWLGAAGAFAIGVSLGPNDRRWLFGGLLVGALGSAVLAVYQILASPQSGALALYDGTQADAALGNPIHLEALLLGALALILGRVCRAPKRWGAAVLLLTIGLEFTSERLSIVILALLVAYALYSYGGRRGGIFALLVAAGYAIAFLSGGAGLGSRVASGTGETTFGTRIRIWWAGANYVLHHPLLGVGPGQTRTAMDSSATLSFYQHVLVGKVLADSHNLFIEVAVTTGLLGLACFLVWLFGAARTAERCCFLGFAAAIIAVELVEPIDIAVLPLAFLALGAAATVSPRGGDLAPMTTGCSESEVTRTGGLPVKRVDRLPLAAIVTTVSIATALFLGVTMVIGDSYMFKGIESEGQPYSLLAAKDANTFLPYWSNSAQEVAQIEAFGITQRGSAGGTDLVDSRHWMAVAVSRDPADPLLWTLLASADIELKKDNLARSEYFHAIACDRWYTEALQGLGELNATQHKWNQAIHWYRMALDSVATQPLPDTALMGLLRVAERNESRARG